MSSTAFDFQIRVLRCQSCGAPLQAAVEGGQISCTYCGAAMLVQRRQIGPVALPHGVDDEQARLAKLRLQVDAPLEDNPYATKRPPPGCGSLLQAARPEVQAQLEQRWREAAALLRQATAAAPPSFEQQRLLWWCATMLNQGYGLAGKHLERRSILESSIELLPDPGFRHMLYANLAGAAAQFRELTAAHGWIEQCDPRPEDIMLDSAYRIGLASVVVREGDARRALSLIGAHAGELPESSQYRLMFALYRIHAYEVLGQPAQAMAASEAALADPEFGNVVIMALRKNELAPQTATAIEARTQQASGTFAMLQGDVRSIDPAISGRAITMIVLAVIALVLLVLAAALIPLFMRLGLL